MTCSLGGKLRERHDPDPIRVEPIAMPLAVLDYGFSCRMAITGLRSHPRDTLSAANDLFVASKVPDAWWR